MQREITKLLPIECVIEGACPGADLLAAQIARNLGIPVLEFPADWKTFGKAAGPIRNRQMLEEGKPTLVLAFHSKLNSSKGTLDMIKQANSKSIEVRIYPI